MIAKLIIVKDGVERVTELIPKDEADKKVADAARCVAEVYEIISCCSKCTRKLREKIKAT